MGLKGVSLPDEVRALLKDDNSKLVVSADSEVLLGAVGESGAVRLMVGTTRCCFEARGLSTMDAASWFLFLVGADGSVVGEVVAGGDVLPGILIVVEDCER